jgi:hypothetical protein
MTATIDAATHLAEIFTRHGVNPSARGATEAEIEDIKRTFAELEFPLPADLLDVYRVTLAIAGVVNCDPVLAAPCIFSGPPVGQVTFLMNEDEDADEEGVLWLGTGNRSDLIIDRDGRCGTVPDFQEDGTVRLKDPTDFETAFIAYVQSQEEELLAEYGGI